MSSHASNSQHRSALSSELATHLDTHQLQVGDIIGYGGFGIVRKGIYNQQTVAIKTVTLQKQANGLDPTQAINLFVAEAKKMKDLCHPNIVRFLGFDATTHSIVMEYVPDGTLEKYIQNNPNMTWKEKFECAMDVAEAMHYLHAKKYNGRKKKQVFHQDLKSANVLLSISQGNLIAKITDFGLSGDIRDKHLHSNSVTKTKSVNTSFVQHAGGTLAYMAPELFQSTKFTKECDVYAYGVLLLELASMLPAAKVIVDYQKWIKTASLPSPFLQFILHCLHLDPTMRPEFELLCIFLTSNQALICDFKPSDPITSLPHSLLFNGSQEDMTKAMNAITLGNTRKKEYSDVYSTVASVATTLALPKHMKHATSKSFKLDEQDRLDDQNKWQKVKKKKRLISIVVFALVGVAVSIALAFILANKRPATTETQSTTPTVEKPLELEQKWNYTRWVGANSMALLALPNDDQDAVLAALRTSHVKIVRVGVRKIFQYWRRSSSEEVADVETEHAGHYAPTILDKLDKLMAKTYQLGMKLIISLHDRNHLGCQHEDVYVFKFNLPRSADCGMNTTNQPTLFYTHPDAISAFDARLAYILNHRNPLLNNRTWASLHEAIYAFDIQHASQGGMTTINSQWLCERAVKVKSLISDRIKIATGGAYDLQGSSSNVNLDCPAVDIVGLTLSQTDMLSDSIASQLVQATQRISPKLSIVEYVDSRINGESMIPRIYQVLQNTTTCWIVADVGKPSVTHTNQFFTDDTQVWAHFNESSRSMLL